MVVSKWDGYRGKENECFGRRHYGPARRISGTHRLMEIGGWWQRACVGLCGMSLVREMGWLVPSDIYQSDWKCHGMPAFTSGYNGASYSPELLIPKNSSPFCPFSCSPCALSRESPPSVSSEIFLAQTDLSLFLITPCISHLQQFQENNRSCDIVSYVRVKDG